MLLPNRFVLAILALVAPLAAGCGPSVHAQVPDGFAVLEGGDDFAFRAANADGVVVAVRSEANKPRGDLAFWSKTLERKLEKRGYVAEGAARKVQSREGTDGLLRTFTISSGGRPHVYWLGVYVHADEVFVVEATGDAESVDAAMRARIESSIASVELPG